jgi:hypothetical protein
MSGSKLAHGFAPRQSQLMLKFAGIFLMLAVVSCATGPGPFTPKSRVQRQMVGLVQKFDRWDDDGNGKLTAKELKPAKKISGQSTEEILNFYDTNHDKSISLKEAQAGFARTGEAEQRVKAAAQ